MAQNEGREIDDFRPKIFDVNVDFIQNRTPITEISMDRLKDAVHLPEGGCDIGTRKEALILDFAGGRIIISDRGLIFAQFRSLRVKQVKELLTSLIRHLCETFNWLPQDQLFTVDADLVVEAPGNSPVETLTAAVNKTHIKELLNVEQDVHAFGFTLFLKPIKDRKRDFRLRIEPLVADPERKYYVRLSDFARELSLGDVESLLDEMAEYAVPIVGQLEGGK